MYMYVRLLTFSFKTSFKTSFKISCMSIKNEQDASLKTSYKIFQD